jgi:hypothetical protein
MARFRRTDWLAGALYPLSVVLTEACWMAPWLAWVGGWSLFRQPRPVLGLASIVATLGLSLLLNRQLQRRPRPLRLTQAITIGAGLVVILLVLGIEYRDGYAFLGGEWFAYFGRLLAATLDEPNGAAPAIAALFYLWWRGIVLGQATAVFRSIYRSFLLGIAALVFLLVFWQAGVSPGPGASTGFYVMGFFFFGLLAIAVSHLYRMRRAMPGEEAARTSVRRWLPVLLGVVGGMVLVGFAASAFFSPEMFDAIGRGANAVFSFFGSVLNYVLVPLNYVLLGLFWLARVIISWLGQEPFQPGASGNLTFPETPEVTLRGLPPYLATLLQWLLVAVAAAAVIFILAKAVARFRGRGEQDEIEEIHESLFSWQGLGDDLAQLLRAMGQRFKRTPHPHLEALSEDEARRLDVREIYRRLLREAAMSGLPRRRPETPAEYARRLGRLVPEGAAPVAGLTELYARVRYGEAAVGEEQVDGANALWAALRGMLRALRERT